jgi:hypothetical protein
VDNDPVTKRPRYVLKQLFRTVSTQISHKIIQAAAGAYNDDAGQEECAKGKVEQHGMENREFLGITSREVALPGVKWNDEGVLTRFDSPGERSATDFDAMPGSPVTVFLRPRNPECFEVASEYYRLMRPKDFIRSMTKKYLRKRKEALTLLNRYWPAICGRISAGPFSKELNELRGGELPSRIFVKIVQAYLS